MNDLSRFLLHAAAAPEAELFRQRRQILQNSRPDFTEAAVLVGFVPEQGGSVVLTVRSNHLRQHSSQIAFPGGRCDAEDADAAATALRETEEELGVRPEVWRLHGQLSPCYLPSGYRVTPILATTPQAPLFRPNPDEVAAVFTLPQQLALDPRQYRLERYQNHGLSLNMPVLRYRQYHIWGATATILYQLACLHRDWRVMPQAT